MFFEQVVKDETHMMRHDEDENYHYITYLTLNTQLSLKEVKSKRKVYVVYLHYTLRLANTCAPKQR